MTSKVAQEIVEAITAQYHQRTERSRANDAKAKNYLPGGDTRSATYFFPNPAYMERGQGCYLYDADENQYLDFLNNYTSLVHGHAHPAVIKAAREQLERGPVLGSASTIQVELAEKICNRIPGMEMVRFCNSGTEATMMAMRAARAFTGKDVIVKMDGGYHGSHDFAEVNVTPDLEAEGLPTPHLEGPGIPACIEAGVMVSRFNDLEATEAILKEHHGQIAAIILEPMPGSGGLIPPQAGYLQGLRTLADRYNVLLIFDEVITFRLSLGGLQRLAEVEPDLTALGKIIGGGFPVGAFGGRREIMTQFDPAQPKSISHSGTFNGHNVVMAAGNATLQHLPQAAIERINHLGDRLREGFNQAFQEAGIKGQATGLGSLVQVHWRDGQIQSPAEALLGIKGAAQLPQLLHLEMMNRGIYSASRGMFITSTAMTEKEIDQVLAAFAGSLSALKPYIVETTPHLIVGDG